MGRDSGDGRWGEMLGFDELHGRAQIIDAVSGSARRLQVSRDPGDAADQAFAVDERDLVGQTPALEVVGIEVEFELLVDGGGGSNHDAILLEIAFAEGGREDLGGGAADEIGLCSGPAALDQRRIDNPVATLEILDEEDHVGDPVEELFDKPH